MKEKINLVKKSVAFIIAATTCLTAVHAEVYEPSMDITSDTVTVSGITPSKLKNRMVNIFILNPGNGIGDIAKEGAIHASLVTSSGEGGVFEASVKINSDVVSEGDMKIIVSGDDFEKCEEKSVWFASSKIRHSALDAINASETQSELAENLKKYADTLSYNTELFKNENTGAIAKILIKTLAQNPLTEQNVYNEMLKLCIIEGFNENLTTLLYDGEKIKYADIIDFDGIDNDYSCNVSEIVNLSDETGKAMILKKLFSNNFTSIEDIRKQYIVNAVIYSVAYPKVSGYAHVEEIVNSTSAQAAGLDNTKFSQLSDSKKDKAAIALCACRDYTISAYQKILDADYSDKIPGPSGGGSSGGGGNRSNTGNGGINIVPENNTKEDKTPENNDVFSDIAGYDWAKEAIMYLYDKGVITGMGNNSFEPEKNVTRAQLAKMICIASGLQLSYESDFEDVDKSKWYYPYISAVSQAGIMIGKDNNTFNPESNVTRQDIAVVTARAAKITPKSKFEFEDAYLISGYAKDSVNALVERNVISGFPDNTFRPFDYCTRAQAAKIIYNALYVK